MTSFRDRAVSAAAWSLVSQTSRLAALRLTSVVLARLLSPTEFGLVTMVTVVTGFAALVSELGLGAAVIQRRDVTRDELSSVFWVNVAIGAALAIAFALGAPLMARLYGEPSLAPLVAAISVTFLVDALGTIQRARLAKALDFRRLSVVEGVAVGVSASVAILMALEGFGVWSLVAQVILLSVVPAPLLWLLGGWRPSFVFDRAGVGRLVPFGLHILGARALNYWSRNVDNLLVGVVLGATELGVYAAAYSIFFFPIQCVTNGLSRALFPAFCLIQDDTARLRLLYLKATQALALVAFPLAFGVLVVAEPLVLTVFGPQWTAMAPLLQIFSVAGIAQSVALENDVFSSRGRADLRLRVEAVCRVNAIAGIVIGLLWGVRGVAIGYAIASVVNWVPQVAVARRQIGVTFGEYARNLLPPMASGATMAAVVWVVARLLPPAWPAWAALTTLVATGVVAYGALVLVARPRALVEIWGMLRERFRAPDGAEVVVE